ncbi:hypothetical protein HO173_010680 [Letharia columbiana]|uniref:Uncharacterized protein n=1 Tax=Letharia columbiana TaxID=112416 RepID=A0A8H6L0N4_9LECA|nr:uncharacterized protein HO173_010680 [Letharia columbiana]KAF6231180.1 hypothetical protein HO173_010680 [Letharia columbiana]
MTEPEPMIEAMSDRKDGAYDGKSTGVEENAFQHDRTDEVPEHPSMTQNKATGEGKHRQDDDDGSKMPTGSASKKRKREIGLPRTPTPGYLQYNTARYELYDPERRNTGASVDGPFKSFRQYDNYTLYSNPGVQEAKDIPGKGVRLDDLAVALVLTQCGQKTLHENWPAEFDLNGMVRATRVGLGLAAKAYQSEGDVDIDGNVVTKAEEGYYYRWWRDIHCLCGKEGLEAGQYKIRPSHEDLGRPGFGFKISSRAKVQLEPGNPNDPSFSCCKAFTTSVKSGAANKSKTATETEATGIA